MKKPVQKNANSKLTISKTKHKVPKPDEVTETTMGIQTFPEGIEPAYVMFKEGLTKNLGDFEYLRLDISVSMPCLPEDIEKTYLKCKTFVESTLKREIDELNQ